MRTSQSRVATIALIVAIAVAFFFAGYSARMIRVAEAANPTPNPIVSPPPPDGNPVGHKLNPPKSVMMAPPPANLKKCLQFLARHAITVVYQLAWPKHEPYRPKPTCSGQPQPCVTFTWKNMTIQTNNYNGSDNKPATVDVYGTLSP